MTTATQTATAIELNESYVGRGAPSNASGCRHGYGRTRQEALDAAGHWNNQAPWARTRTITIRDYCDRSRDAAWHVCGWIEQYLPPTPAGEAILRLLRAEQYGQSVIAYYAARDAGVPLVAERF